MADPHLFVFFGNSKKLLQAAEAAAPKAKRVPLKELAQGAEFTGKVKGIKEFGVFVDFGAESDGLVHISQMSAGFVSNPTDIAKMGDTVSPPFSSSGCFVFFRWGSCGVGGVEDGKEGRRWACGSWRGEGRG